MSFDLNIARRCLEASADAYAGGTIESELAHVLIVDASDEVMVAFRGTANIRDWITDLDCWMGCPNCASGLTENCGATNGVEVHLGFLRALMSVFDRVVTELRQYDGAKLIITGHSLGGALAMLFSKAFSGSEANAVPIIDSVYTFGQPRVGNGAFAKTCNEKLGDRTWRFVNEEDIVPRVPGLLAGYRHAGQEVFLPVMGEIKINPPIWVKLISDGIGLYQEWKQGKIALLADHATKSYKARLGMLTAENAETANA